MSCEETHMAANKAIVKIDNFLNIILNLMVFAAKIYSFPITSKRLRKIKFIKSSSKKPENDNNRLTTNYLVYDEKIIHQLFIKNGLIRR